MLFCVLVNFHIFILNTPKHIVMIYKRNCPKCGDEIQHKNPRSFKWAKRDGKPCRKCYSKVVSETLKKKYKSGELTVVKKFRKDKKYFKECPNCNSTMGYTTQKGLDSAILKNTICNSCSTKIHKKGIMNGLTIEQTQQMRATKAGFENFEEYKEKYPKKEMYKREVWRYTYKHPLETLEHWDKRGKCGVDGAYQLDHIISINEGWSNKIPAEEIAKWENLRMIPWKDNLLKGG